ncbi:hypothetical protein EV702DRAFT_1043571 [Suillus placidus]|uniref:Uncharacterized protein n=1 Tax=Suillus placidus TaxID=48579 RepID=A0A9P7A1C6_9AGAM|nr:hypothetical protein EV702DRAFT_1043571 [Suillus placidus]
MQPPSSPSSVITAPPSYHENAQRLAKLIAESKTCRFSLLHYDSSSKTMVDWCWPADGDGKKIPPSDLEKHRDEYDFRYPCCLCADGGGRGTYTEAAVYPWWNKTMRTTCWNTRCASDRCGYQVKMDMYFQLARLVAYQYPRREWTFREQTELLNELDSSVGDGISVKDFRILFKRCKKCMQVGARPAMNRHICSGGVQKRRN